MTYTVYLEGEAAVTVAAHIHIDAESEEEARDIAIAAAELGSLNDFDPEWILATSTCFPQPDSITIEEIEAEDA